MYVEIGHENLVLHLLQINQNEAKWIKLNSIKLNSTELSQAGSDWIGLKLLYAKACKHLIVMPSSNNAGAQLSYASQLSDNTSDLVHQAHFDQKMLTAEQLVYCMVMRLSGFSTAVAEVLSSLGFNFWRLSFSGDFLLARIYIHTAVMINTIQCCTTEGILFSKVSLRHSYLSDSDDLQDAAWM